MERHIEQDELNRAKEHAEAANQTKSAFLANMSHELRTPLNAIIGYSELLVDDVKSSEQKEIATDLKKISSSGHHLLSLINDVLDISKIEAGKMALSLQETNINNLVADVAGTFEPSLKKNNDELITHYNTEIGNAIIDPMRLKQCVINLLGNAVKFTENGKIAIETNHQMRKGRLWITISVADNGIGIEPEAVTQLFKPFSQASAETSIKYGGTGLGLSISQHMCRLMGGDITVDSKKGEGSTFTIWLPENQANISSLQVASN